MIFFSAHGVPRAYVEEAGDPYKDEMEHCHSGNMLVIYIYIGQPCICTELPFFAGFLFVPGWGGPVSDVVGI